MSTRIELAKQLIEKAKELNDDKLLEMALSLLQEEKPTVKEEKPKKVIEKKEVKRGRKKKAAVTQPTKSNIVDPSSFMAPVRAEGVTQKRTITLPDGKVKTLTRREKISLKQKFYDDGKTDKNDKANEQLKKVTVYSPRDRQSNSSHEMICENCSKKEMVPSFLVYDTIEFLCTECTGRKIRDNVG